MALTLILVGGLCGANATAGAENLMPARVTGAWTFEMGPGSVTVDGREVVLAEPVTLKIAPPERVEVRDEKHGPLPLFNPNAGGWLKGVRLTCLITEECTATGLLFPESLRVKPGPGGARPFKLDIDCALDPFWAAFGRVEGGAIAQGQEVFVDYRYSPDRLDGVFANTAGEVSLVRGQSGVGVVLPPEGPPDAVRIANVWVPGRLGKLTEEQLFPCYFDEDPAPKAVAEKLLPKTRAKLRSGEALTIVAWGDSVTNGGGVNQERPHWYQNQFLAKLKARFPQARIDLKTAAWPGGNSAGYMKAPPGGTYDYQRDVLDPKPDLVTIEFVNDAYLDVPKTKKHYAKILEDLRGVGAEVVLITPHLVRPDWLKSNTLKVAKDPRPYVAGLREFAAENDVALADASREWCRLWRKGIPYTTLLANSINHPDVRGHRIFAEVLIGLFPKE